MINFLKRKQASQSQKGLLHAMKQELEAVILLLMDWEGVT